MTYVFTIFYLFILLCVAFIQIGFLSLASLLIYRFFSGKRPSKRQILFCAATMVVLNVIMIIYAVTTGTLDTTVPQWYFATYCIVLIVAGALAAAFSTSGKSVSPGHYAIPNNMNYDTFFKSLNSEVSTGRNRRDTVNFLKQSAQTLIEKPISTPEIAYAITALLATDFIKSLDDNDPIHEVLTIAGELEINPDNADELRAELIDTILQLQDSK